MELLVAMHAPDGECILRMESGANSPCFMNWQVVSGDPAQWENTFGGRRIFYAKNKDASQHLWVTCEVYLGDLNDGGGEIWEGIRGNAASMWVSINGGEHIGVSTNFPPPSKTVFRWFTLSRGVGRDLPEKYIRDDDVPWQREA
jgi:hypothetical protein